MQHQGQDVIGIALQQGRMLCEELPPVRDVAALPGGGCCIRYKAASQCVMPWTRAWVCGRSLMGTGCEEDGFGMAASPPDTLATVGWSSRMRVAESARGGSSTCASETTSLS